MTESLEEVGGRNGEPLDAVNTLLALLVESTSNVSGRMRVAGYSDDEIQGAWNYARAAGFTESSGLGPDRLTEAGRERVLRF